MHVQILGILITLLAYIMLTKAKQDQIAVTLSNNLGHNETESMHDRANHRNSSGSRISENRLANQNYNRNSIFMIMHLCLTEERKTQHWNRFSQDYRLLKLK